MGMIGDVDGFEWGCTLLVIVDFVGTVGFIIGVPGSDGRVLIVAGERDCSVFEEVIDGVGGL